MRTPMESADKGRIQETKIDGQKLERIVRLIRMIRAGDMKRSKTGIFAKLVINK